MRIRIELHPSGMYMGTEIEFPDGSGSTLYSSDPVEDFEDCLTLAAMQHPDEALEFDPTCDAFVETNVSLEWRDHPLYGRVIAHRDSLVALKSKYQAGLDNGETLGLQYCRANPQFADSLLNVYVRHDRKTDYHAGEFPKQHRVAWQIFQAFVDPENDMSGAAFNGVVARICHVLKQGVSEL